MMTKKAGITMVGAVLGLLLAASWGYSAGTTTLPPSPMNGDWLLTYTLDSGEPATQTYWHITTRAFLGTFVQDDLGYSGRTVYNPFNQVVTLVVRGGAVAYTGSISADGLTMSGTIAGNEVSGTWSAMKIIP